MNLHSSHEPSELSQWPSHVDNTINTVTNRPTTIIILGVQVRGGRVGLATEIVGSNPTPGCCVPTPTQHAIPPGSVKDYQRKLGSKRAYHAMHWPRIRGRTAVRLRAKNGE